MDDQGRYSIAAASGALISALRTATGTWQRRAILFFSGYGFSVWVGPVLIDYFRLSTEQQILGLGFCAGYLGDMCLTLGSYWADRLIRHHLVALMRKDD